MAASHTSESLDAAFQMAVASFAANLTDRQRCEFKGCSLKEVEDTIKDVETRLASQRKQRNMQRLSSFLEGMNQLGKVIEIFVNCDSTVAFIWGPIKFVLLMIGTWVETLDSLLDTYVEIGEFLPSLSQYESLLAKYPGIGVHLHRYYCDVLEFHRNALSVFSRPSWKIVFHSAWKTFRAKFGPTLTKLKRHRDLLSGEKLAATVTDVHQSVHYIEDKVDMLSRQLERLHYVDSEEVSRRYGEDLDRKRQFVLAKLDPPDYHYDLEKALNERQTSNSGDWLLADTTFEQWADMTTMESRDLYLNGIPGSGRQDDSHIPSSTSSPTATESANLIDNSCRFMVLYFFFKHSQPKKSNFIAMLRSLLSQTLFQDEVLLDLVYQRCVRSDQQKITSISLLRELLIQVLQAQRICFIVVDALDECTEDQIGKPRDVQGQIIDWLESVGRDENSGESSDRCVRLLISGQRNGVLDDRLRHWPAIQLDSSVAHKNDIEMYCEVQSHRIRQEFDSVEGIEDIRLDIIRRVSSRAKGMFLYAKVVLNNLLDQPTSAHFERELQEENFPHGLDQAYERVAIHVLESDLEKRLGLARRILNLIICAERPLRWKEIQSRFSIEVEFGTANPKLRLLRPAKYHCGSLVEISRNNEHTQLAGFAPDDSVELVHETARTYLIQTGRFHLPALHSEMALFCAQYLYSAPFDPGVNDYVIRTHCMTGYYGFLEYAASNWWKHAKRLRELESEGLRAIVCLVGALNPQYQLGPDAIIDHMTDIWTRVRQLSDDSRDWERNFPIQTRIHLIRTYFDALFGGENIESPANLKRLQEFYGRSAYKCHKPWCDFFQDGFNSTSARDDHVNQHELPFRCSDGACHRFRVGFARESELHKHRHRLHTQATSVDFPSKRCGSIFKAATQGRLEVLQDLVAHGASFNVRDKSGSTPLFLAARAGKCDVCRWLLKQGAEVDARCTKQSLTALHAAVANDDVEIALLLIAEYGADIYACTSTGDGMQAVMEQERCTKVREVFPPDFWNQNLSAKAPYQDNQAKKIQGDVQVTFNVKFGRALDVDLVHTLEHESVARCVKFSFDGKYLATGCDGEAHVYDAATGERIYVFKEEADGPTREIYIRSVCFSPDGKYLVTGSENTLVQVWDMQKIRLDTTFEGHVRHVYSVDVSRDGRTIASGGADQTVRIWDLEKRGCRNVLTVDDRVTRVAISPDTKLVAAGSSNNRSRVWDIETCSLLYSLEGHRDSIFGMAFSPNGLKLATCGLDRTIKMWEIDRLHEVADSPLPYRGKCIKTLEGHQGLVLDVAFTPDSRWMISGSNDRSNIRFWDPQTGATQLMIRGHGNSALSVDSSPLVTPLGGLFATGSDDMRARIWSYTYRDSEY